MSESRIYRGLVISRPIITESELPSERLAELKRKVEEQLAIIQERLLTLGVIAPTTIEHEEKNMSDDDVDPKVAEKFKRELRWGYDKLTQICGDTAIVSYVRSANGSGNLIGITVVAVGVRQFWLEYDDNDNDWDLWQCDLQDIGQRNSIKERWHDEYWQYIEHALGKLLGDLWLCIDEPKTMGLG